MKNIKSEEPDHIDGNFWECFFKNWVMFLKTGNV
jgi:hypothetical protein